MKIYLKKFPVKAYVFLLLMAMGVFTSCKKYEDGPYLSLRSKTERVANTWKPVKVIENGKDVTSDYSDLRITFTKGGDVSWTSGGGISIESKGTWQFINDKDDLQTIFDRIFGQEVRTFRILKLKEDTLWLKEGDREYQLESA